MMRWFSSLKLFGAVMAIAVAAAIPGKPRTVIDIAKAAELCVSEESRDGLRIRKDRGSSDSTPPTAEDEAVLPTMPPEANEAA
jgi:hypothetical protein